MADASKGPRMLVAGKLFERTSPSTGERYLSGRLGQLRLVVVSDPEPGRGRATFTLLLEPMPEGPEEPDDPMARVRQVLGIRGG